MKHLLKKPLMILAVTGVLVMSHGAAMAQLKIGVVLSMTGPAASFTKSVRNAVDLFPKEIAGEKLELMTVPIRSQRPLSCVGSYLTTKSTSSSAQT